MSLHKLSLYELHEKFTAGEVSAVEIVRAYGLRIGQVESKVKAYITQAKDAAVAQAGALDASLKVWRKTLPMMGMRSTASDDIVLNDASVPDGDVVSRRLLGAPAPSAPGRTTPGWKIS